MDKLIDRFDLFYSIPVPTFTLNRKRTKSSCFGAFMSLLLLATGIVYTAGRLTTIVFESSTATVNTRILEGFYGVDNSYHM